MEIFKDVIGFEERYAISNYGRLKAKSYLKSNHKGKHYTKEKILKIAINKHGYYFQKLHFNDKIKTFKIHQLVAMMFLDHVPNGHNIYVDHIDQNKLNNHVDNLRIVTPSMSVLNRNIIKTSKYPYVSFDEKRNKWIVRKTINGKYKFLGRFNTEIEAYNKSINYEK